MTADSNDLPAEPAGRTKPRRRWPALAGGLLTAVCLVFVARALASEWTEVRDRLAHADPTLLLASLAVGALGMTAIAWVWGDALRVLGAGRPRRLVVAWYFVGELGKYLPGAIWAAVGRGELARRDGVPRPQAYPSVVLSLAALYMAAAMVAAVLLPFGLAARADAGWALVLLALVPVGFVALHPRVLEAVRSRLVALTGRELPVEIPRWGTSIGLVLRYIPAWLFIGLSTWLMARALVPSASIVLVVLATALSWTAGFMTPTPSGAGVREGVFIALAGLPTAEGAAVAVASRLVFVIVDVAGAIVGLPVTRRRAAGPVPVASAGPEPFPEGQEES